MTKTVTYLMLGLLSLTGCSKKKKSECPPQPAVALAPPLHFIIVDKLTGKDLFFSNSPEYTEKDLICYTFWTNTSNNMPFTDTLRVMTDLSLKCFMISPNKNTVCVKIANSPADTLVIKSHQPFTDSPCSSGSYIQSVEFRGQLYEADNNRVITLKK